MAHWGVQSKREVRALVDLLDRYPLRAKKRLDYALWREAVLIWQDVGRAKRLGKGQGSYSPTANAPLLHRLAELRVELMEVRKYGPAIPLEGRSGDDVEFFSWLSGFIDAEGWFSIKPCGATAYGCRCGIGLRADDRPVLEEVTKRTGLGIVRTYYRETSVSVWSVHRKAELGPLIALLDAYPLRAKKRTDYKWWRSAALVWQDAGQRVTPARSASLFSEMAYCKKMLDEVRVFDGADGKPPRHLP